MTDTRNGLRIESASSVIARDMIEKHIGTFAHVIRRDRAANQSVVAAYIDGLAAVVAITIAGGHGSRSEVIDATVAKLRENIDRDLKHLARQ
jgi:hypothetical protein